MAPPKLQPGTRVPASAPTPKQQSDPYGDAIVAPLRIKGAPLPTVGYVPKKRRPREPATMIRELNDEEKQKLEKLEAEKDDAEAAVDAVAHAVAEEQNKRAREEEREEQLEAHAAATYDSLLTPAEREYQRRLKEREELTIAKKAVKSHRQRIEEFNAHLASLSEHHDIPKVGPG
eukprot:GAFH01005640.1.p1 GENE.GAFH01005640.1~~GAFH01005640.1.p1  ORF type:complete len:175 (+),score=13.77 GAFH01005640.1:15-539(+)